MTKYGFEYEASIVKQDLNRLANQIWKLIPMKENKENWQTQLETVIVELIGLQTIFVKDINFLILLSKLEGLKNTELDFVIYRKTVFESLSLLKEICKNEYK